jgi:hypothetical protein
VADDQNPLNLCETEFSEIYDLILVVSLSDIPSAAKELRQYADPQGERSIRAAVMADVTLGGTVQTVFWRTPSPTSGIAIDQNTYLGKILHLEVWN